MPLQWRHRGGGVPCAASIATQKIQVETNDKTFSLALPLFYRVVYQRSVEGHKTFGKTLFAYGLSEIAFFHPKT